MESKIFITVAETVTMLDVSRQRIHSLIQKEKLRVIYDRLGKRYLVNFADVREILNSRFIEKGDK